MMELEQLISKVKTLLLPREEIVFAYLFGSVANNQAGPLSDIDIAVYIREDIKVNSGAFGYKAELIANLQQELNSNKIDLVILNQAPLFLAFNVLKEGKLVFCSSEETRIDYFYRIQRDYLDFKPALKVQNDYLKREVNNLKLEGE